LRSRRQADPDVAVTADNLAALFKSRRKYEEAERLYRYALDIFEKALGPKHPKVVRCRENYARLLGKMLTDQDVTRTTA
jgi:hypothetical protein